jgi:hypothetical protein
VEEAELLLSAILGTGIRYCADGIAAETCLPGMSIGWEPSFVFASDNFLPFFLSFKHGMVGMAVVLGVWGAVVGDGGDDDDTAADDNDR